MIKLSPRVVLAIAVGLLAVMVLLARCGEERRSDTADEAMHVVRGVPLLQQSDTTLSYSHPPLANTLTALPLLPDIDRVDVTTLRGWEHRDPVAAGHAYFTRDLDAGRHDLSRARDAMAVIAVAFAVYVFAWCWRRWDPATALVALALVAGSPTILAHAGLATTDLPCAFAGFAALTGLVAWLESGRRMHLLAFAVAIGVLLATKHSGAPMLATMAIVALGCAWMGRMCFAGPSRARRLGRAVVGLGVVGVVALTIVNASYRFDKTGMTVDEIVAHPEPHNWISRPHENDILRAPAFVPGGMPVPLPYAYIYGLTSISRQASVGHRGYFFGISSRRNPLYFPVMTILKQPIGVLALLGLAAWAVRRRTIVPRASTWIMVLWCALFVALASASRINIGVRHVLVVFPVMLVLAARMAVIGWHLLADRRWARPVIAASVATATIAGPLAVPHTIGWFNGLVGGPAGGNWVAVIGEDWGQNTTELALWLRDHGHDEVHYHAPGRPLRPLEVRRWGITTHAIECDEIPPAGSVVAVHRTSLVRTPKCLAWLDSCTELEVIDHHVHVYRCDDADALTAARKALPAKGEAEPVTMD